MSNILPMYENIPKFLDIYYENWPQSYIYSSVLGGTHEHEKKQISILKELGFDVILFPFYITKKSKNMNKIPYPKIRSIFYKIPTDCYRLTWSEQPFIESFR